MNKIILIAGAFRPEINLLLSSCKKRKYTFENTPIVVRDLGIGVLESTLNLQKFLIECSKRKISICEIVFLGSAGIYPNPSSFRIKPTLHPFLKCGPLSFAFSQYFLFRDIARIRGQAFKPEKMVDKIVTKAGPLAHKVLSLCDREQFCNFYKENIIVNTTPYISKVRVLEKEIVSKEDFSFFNQGNLGYLENLECYGLAYVAKKHKVRFSSFLALTNFVGETSHEEWLRNFRIMSSVLQKLFLHALD